MSAGTKSDRKNTPASKARRRFRKTADLANWINLQIARVPHVWAEVHGRDVVLVDGRRPTSTRYTYRAGDVVELAAHLAEIQLQHDTRPDGATS